MKATATRTTRRGNGEGSIFQRKDGRWVGAVTVGCNAAGKRVRRVVYGSTKQEVGEKLTRLAGQKLDGTLGVLDKQTLAAFLARWLEDSARPTVRATTYQNYETIVRLHINPRVGGVRLSKLTPAHVQGLYAELDRNGTSAFTRCLVHCVLHRALKQGVRWGLLVRNPCDSVDPPKPHKRQISPLNAAQVGLLLEAAAGYPLYALYVLAVTTGLRLGELFGLQWGHVNLRDRSLQVTYSLQELCGKVTLTEPKTASSRRKIELSQMAVDALTEHLRLAMAAGRATGHVFVGSSGLPIRRGNFHRQSFKPLLKRAGLPDIRFHDLRHTSATLLLSQGVHPKVVQERLGHSKISMTLDIYSHCLPTMQRDAADGLDRLLCQPAAKASAG